MHTVMRTADARGWLLIFSPPAGEYFPIREFVHFDDAAAMASYLNGGFNPAVANELHEAIMANSTFCLEVSK